MSSIRSLKVRETFVGQEAMRFLSVPTFFLWRGNPEISRSQPNMSRMPRGCEITLQGFNKDIGSVS